MRFSQNPLFTPPANSRTFMSVEETRKRHLKMKLLIVEDNAQMRSLIRELVRDLAGPVTECTDGDEALEAYSAQQFTSDDRVLMDLQMPRVGGLEATRRIRAIYPDAQIIIVTQHDDPHWRTAARESGAMAFVLKQNLLELRNILQTTPQSKT